MRSRDCRRPGRFVVDAADALAGPGVFGVIDVDHQYFAAQAGQRLLHHGEYSRSVINTFASP
jgi:hypothetical protein